jgi:hypothetical protein
LVDVPRGARPVSAFPLASHVVIIAAEVEEGKMIEKGLRGTVFRLKPTADAAYGEWELSQLFPKWDVTIH